MAVNGHTGDYDLISGREAGHDAALKRVVEAEVKDGKLVIDFPKKAGQAVICTLLLPSYGCRWACTSSR